MNRGTAENGQHTATRRQRWSLTSSPPSNAYSPPSGGPGRRMRPRYQHTHRQSARAPRPRPAPRHRRPPVPAHPARPRKSGLRFVRSSSSSPTTILSAAHVTGASCVRRGRAASGRGVVGGLRFGRWMDAAVNRAWGLRPPRPAGWPCVRGLVVWIASARHFGRGLWERMGSVLGERVVASISSAATA